MKGFLTTTCLLALLFTMSSCEGTVEKLMSVMRNGWARLSSEKTVQTESDSSKTADVPKKATDGLDPKFAAQLEEIQKMATQPTTDTVARNEKVLARIQEFNSQYPVYQPIRRDSMAKTFVNPLPKTYGDYVQIRNVGESIYAGTLKKSTFLYEQPARLEELLPHVYFPPNKDGLVHAAYYRSQYGQPSGVFVIDRGYLGGWLVRAHWYYLNNKHFVGSDKRKWYSCPENGQYETADSVGRYWVRWLDTGSNTATGVLSGGQSTYVSYWKDRWEVVLDLGGNPEVINPAWEKTLR